MPKRLEGFDRDFIRDLYIQGIPPSKISKQVGLNYQTLMQWAKRGGWTQAKASLSQGLDKMMERPLAFVLREQGVRVRKRIADDIERASKKLPRDATTITGFKQRQDGIGSLVKNASTVFGWEETKSQTLNVQILSTLGKVNFDDIGKQIEATEVKQLPMGEPKEGESCEPQSSTALPDSPE